MNINIIQQCRVCNSNNISFDKEIPSFLSKKDIRRFFVCNDCGTIMDSADTAPDMAVTDTSVEKINMLELPASYIKHYIEVGAGLFSFASQLQLLTTLFPDNCHNNIKYLDIGCGFGFSVHMAQKFGWESIGVEPLNIGKVGSEILEFNLVSDYLEKSSIPQYNFNFVSASEAIEHVQDPDVFIQNIAKYVSPKGVLFLTTPNAESIILGSEIEEEWLEGYSPGSHFNLLSPDAIRLILSRNGFEYVKIILSEGSSGQKRMTILASKDDVLPESIDWNDIRTNTHIFLKKYLKEIIFERAAKRNKDIVYNSALCRLFELFVNEGEYEEAKKYIIEIDEIIAGLGFNLAVFDISKNKAENFEQHAQQVPGYLAHYLYYKGMIYLNHDKNYHEANNYFKFSADVSQLNEEIANFCYPGKWYGRAKFHQGLALLYDGKQEGAIKIFDTLLSEREKLPVDTVENLYWNKGIAHLQIKKNHQVLHSFKKFIVNKFPESTQPALQVIKVLNKLIKVLDTLISAPKLITQKIIKLTDITISEDALEVTVGEILSGRVIEQELIVHGSFSKISLKLGTFERLNTSQLYVDILDENKKQIRHIVKNANIFADNHFHIFSFPVIPDSQGKKYWLRLSSNADIGNAVTLWCKRNQGDGSLIINHKPSENALIYELGYGDVNTRIVTGTKDILIITPDKLGKVRLGLGMRHWEIANALAKKGLDVALATPHPIPNDVQAEGFDLHSALSPANVLDIAQEYKVVMVQGDVLRRYSKLEMSNKPIIVDMVTPFHIEDIEKGQKEFENGYSVIRQCLLRGDFFVCGNESQRIYWLGMLTALGRINKQVRDKNAAFYKLIDVAGFGIPEQPPVKSAHVLKGVFSNIHEHDFVIMWMGGIWDWLDPLTLIKGVHQAHQKDARVKLFFPAYRQSNGQPSNMAKKARDLCLEIGALDKSVFFNEYPIPYEERVNYLLESDVGVVCQAANFETQISARTRVLDYIWTGLPILINQGDEWCELVRKHNLGVVVQGNSADDWENAITELAMNTEARKIKVDNIDKIKYQYQWNHLVEPIINYLNLGAID